MLKIKTAICRFFVVIFVFVEFFCELKLGGLKVKKIKKTEQCQSSLLVRMGRVELPLFRTCPLNKRVCHSATSAYLCGKSLTLYIIKTLLSTNFSKNFKCDLKK